MRRKFNKVWFLFSLTFLFGFTFLLLYSFDLVLRVASIIGVSIYTLNIYGQMKKLKRKNQNPFGLLGSN